MAAVARVQYFLGQYIYRWAPIRMGFKINNFLTQQSGSSIDFGYCSYSHFLLLNNVNYIKFLYEFKIQFICLLYM